MDNESLKLKILVVDDEEEVFQVVSGILNPFGHELLFADNGTKGLIMAKDQKPDLMIIDINMPIMDGFELQRLLKECEPTKHIPILFLTAATIFEYKTHALSEGAIGFLQKPIDFIKLINIVDILTNRSGINK